MNHLSNSAGLCWGPTQKETCSMHLIRSPGETTAVVNNPENPPAIASCLAVKFSSER